MENQFRPEQPSALQDQPEARLAVKAASRSGLVGIWRVAWPLVVGGILVAGGATLSKRLAKVGQPQQPSSQTGSSTPAPEPKLPEPQATLEPKVVEVDPFEDALRPEGTREFLGHCRAMDEVMNLDGVEKLARKRLVRVPDSYLAWAVIGYVYEWRGQPDEALMAYKNAKALLDQDRDMAVQPVQARAEMEMLCTGKAGIYLFCQGDQDARFATCRKAVMERPADDGAWFVLGFTAASRQNFAVMALCAEKLERLNPAKAAQFKEACIEPMRARLGAARRGGSK